MIHTDTDIARTAIPIHTNTNTDTSIGIGMGLKPGIFHHNIPGIGISTNPILTPG